MHSLLNVHRESLTLVEDRTPNRGGSYYDFVFRSYNGVIPLRGVIRDNLLVTVWPLGGWRKVTIDRDSEVMEKARPTQL